jgi:hypothetical protein
MAWQLAETGGFEAMVWAHIVVGPVLVILLCIGLWWMHRASASADDQPTEPERTDEANPFGDSN